jgi:hypothetical protein
VADRFLDDLLAAAEKFLIRPFPVLPKYQEDGTEKLIMKAGVQYCLQNGGTE